MISAIKIKPASNYPYFIFKKMYNSLVFLFTHLECSFCLLLIILLLILPIVCIFNTISSSHVFEVNISGSWYFEMSSLEIFVLALKSRLHVCLGRSGF